MARRIAKTELKLRYDPDRDLDSRPSAQFAGNTRTLLLLRGNAAVPDKNQICPQDLGCGRSPRQDKYAGRTTAAACAGTAETGFSSHDSWEPDKYLHDGEHKVCNKCKQTKRHRGFSRDRNGKQHCDRADK